MPGLPWCRMLIRSQGVGLVNLAALHSLVIAWTAWYLAEAAWSAAPLSASPAPLPRETLVAPWVIGTLLLLVIGMAAGASAIRGPWVGPDPILGLPVTLASRAAAAWVSSVALLGIVAVAPLPIYLALLEMASIAMPAISVAVLVQAGAIALAPLAGIGLALARRRAGWPTSAGQT